MIDLSETRCLIGKWPWPLGVAPADVIAFDVHGPPKPSPRARKGKGGKVRRDPSADNWQESIREAVVEELRWHSEQGRDEAETRIMMDDSVFGPEPLQLKYELRIERPKSHFDSGGVLKPKALPWPSIKPDIDNFEKAVYDALGNWKRQGVLLWDDDCQIIAVTQVERYALCHEAPGLSMAVGVALATVGGGG